MIRKDISEEEKHFLKQSYCENIESNDVIPEVCCHPVDLCIEDCGWFSNSMFGAYLNPPNLDDFSWLVLIQEESKEESNEFLCVGSLISNQYILTAASCFDHSNTNATNFSARLGDIELGISPDCIENECLDPEFNIPISEIIMHDIQNIALVKLNESLIFEKAVSPICLFENIDGNSGRSKLEVVGFKNESKGTRKREKLMVNTMQMGCEPEMLCVKDACVSNAGGPLMKLVHHGKYNTRYTLVGVQSDGDCNQMKFTKIEPLLDWIRRKMLPY